MLGSGAAGPGAAGCCCSTSRHHLDPRNQHEALRTVRRVAKERNISVCIILHDLNLAIRYCDRFLFLRDSEVYAYGGVRS